MFLTVKNVKLLFLKGKLPKNAGQIIKELLSNNNIVTSKFKSCVTLKKDESEKLLQEPRRKKRSIKINLIVALNIEYTTAYFPLFCNVLSFFVFICLFLKKKRKKKKRKAFTLWII